MKWSTILRKPNPDFVLTSLILSRPSIKTVVQPNLTINVSFATNKDRYLHFLQNELLVQGLEIQKEICRHVSRIFSTEVFVSRLLWLWSMQGQSRKATKRDRIDKDCFRVTIQEGLRHWHGCTNQKSWSIEGVPTNQRTKYYRSYMRAYVGHYELFSDDHYWTGSRGEDPTIPPRSDVCIPQIYILTVQSLWIIWTYWEWTVTPLPLLWTRNQSQFCSNCYGQICRYGIRSRTSWLLQ